VVVEGKTLGTIQDGVVEEEKQVVGHQKSDWGGDEEGQRNVWA
jgi:hypothetical protein